MRRRISLYIDGSAVELDEESFILFNYTRDEVSNPTIVRNSYSQTISLPGTARNNDIFGRLFRLDSDSFNPLRKADFIIYNEMNEILERGYARLDNITTERGKAVYKVSLFGGLGGFFYNLMYDSEGNKKNLADLLYYRNRVRDPEQQFNPATTAFHITKDAVKSAWDFLEVYDANAEVYDLVNFAPCNNGFPSFKFSTDKAVYKPGSAVANQFPNLYTTQQVTEGGSTYTYVAKENGTILLEMENKHTEWEVEDLRSYLQRPCLHFRRFIEALEIAENTTGYTFRIDPDADFFADDSKYWESWMTLPLIDRDKVDPATTTLADILKNTASPAEYLISFAKVFGLCFLTDKDTNTITLTDRNHFYTGTIDLTERVARDKEIKPCTMDAKFYDFAYPSVFGEFAKNYEEKYGRKYGLKRVNTGYDFNSEHEDVLKGIVFNGCADVLETSPDFRYYPGTIQGEYGQSINNDFKFAFSEQVTWKLYTRKNDGGSMKLVESTFSPLQTFIATQTYSTGARDFVPRPQLHGADNKGEDGANVLLFLDGFVNTPDNVVSGLTIDEARFHLSDDSETMLSLNAGEPCYDVSYTGANILPIYRLPSFRRTHTNSAIVERSLDLGTPLEVATEETQGDSTNIYGDAWASYIADKFNKDSRVVTIKVDLSGMKVDESLLRKFYHFGGCWWVLNKINNYSLTTYDDVECEFIKVQDMGDVQSGQNY